MASHCFSSSDVTGSAVTNASFYFRRSDSLEDLADRDVITPEYTPALNLSHFLDHLPYECCRGAQVSISLRSKRTVLLQPGRQLKVTTLTYLTSQHRKWSGKIEKSSSSAERAELKERKISVATGPLSQDFLGNIVLMLENRGSTSQTIFGGQGLAKLEISFCVY